MAKYIRWFSELSKKDVNIVGGKGANLGEMFSSGFPVPPGFVLTANAYFDFIKKTGLGSKIQDKLRGLDVEDTAKLQQVSKDIQALFLSEKIPEEMEKEIITAYDKMSTSDKHLEKVKGKALEIIKAGRDLSFVAVRSSATAEDLPEASFAGQQATFLNVKGIDQLFNAIQHCWGSLFTARAIYYRERNNFDHMKVALAAVVQKMVNSSKSGVMFSINPATNNMNQIVIEAGWGLGEAIVQGSIDPDMYVVDKTTGEIIEKKVNFQDWYFIRDSDTGKTIRADVPEHLMNAQVLTEHEIKVLAELAKKVEDHYGFAQDMEWAVEKKNLYLVQTRNVTTVKKSPVDEAESAKISAEVLVKGLEASPGIASGVVKKIFSMDELNKVQKGDILVTTMTTPDFVPAMQKAAAIVTDHGGLTSHAAIVSREMGVPCIVGSSNATSILQDNMEVTVDATKGVVYKGILKQKLETMKAPQVQATQGVPSVEYEEEIETATKVKVVMDLPDYAEKAARTGADGVGLLRIETMIAGSGKHPSMLVKTGREQEYIDLLANNIMKIASAFKNKPVWVRTSDMRTDEYRNLEGGAQEPVEANPMLGWHGIRRAMDQPEIITAEFKAIKKLWDAGYKNIGVMIPFVTRIEEVKKAKELLRFVGLEPGKDIDFGVMIETPASVMIIEQICEEGIDFVSFGTNDLTQTTLGVDRNNENLHEIYNEMHPAVLREIASVIKTCKKHSVKTSICGQAGSRPEMAEFLVRLGIDSISSAPDAVHEIRRTVYQTERKILLEAARKGA